MVKVVKGEEKERHETWQAATRGEEFLQIKLLLSAEPPTSDLSLNPPQPGMIVSDCFAESKAARRVSEGTLVQAHICVARPPFPLLVTGERQKGPVWAPTQRPRVFSPARQDVSLFYNVSRIYGETISRMSKSRHFQKSCVQLFLAACESWGHVCRVLMASSYRGRLLRLTCK